MDKRTPVLIIGAGPTGLLMACELARHDVHFRIIDKKPDRTLAANAVAIQARTLELFDNIGIVQRFLKLGHPITAVEVRSHGRDLARVSFTSLDSPYPFILALPQSETERLLIEHLRELKHEVERSQELIALKQQDNTVIATIRHDEGATETITADWVIACDGANSKVRTLCQIPFPGADLSEQFVVTDAKMSSFLSNDEVHVFLNKGTLLASIPLGGDRYRMVVNLHQSHPRKLFIEKEVKEVVQERSQSAFDVDSVSWISPFWIHDKIVEKMRYGSIFLAGDAAHIHSPAGGQGMNTGLQDAYNLAWKLALVIKGNAKPTLLDSYQEERYPVVNDIVKRAERFTKIALVENPFLRALRYLFFNIVNIFAKYSNAISMKIAQLSIQYKNSSVIDYNKRLSQKSPQAGERVRDSLIDHSMRLQDYLRNTKHNVLLFTGLKPDDHEADKIRTLQQWFSKTYPDLIKTHVIAKERIDGVSDLILDMDGAVHDKYRVKKPAFYIIRPDNYIAYCGVDLDPKLIEKFLTSYLI